MSEKILRVFTCDLCGEELGQDELSSVRIPTWSRVSDEDGKGVAPYVAVDYMDLCDECVRKVAVVRRGCRCVEGIGECPHDAVVYSHNSRTRLANSGGAEVVER